MPQVSKISTIFRVLVRNKSSQANSAGYCVDLVRKHDYENFLCTLLLPSSTRSTAFAVRAFNIEVSQVYEKAKEKDTAVARMKFWEHSLNSIYKTEEMPDHPVVLELARAVSKHKFPKKQLSRLIYARASTFAAKTMFETLTDMEKYCEETISPVYYLIIQSSGIMDMNADHAASHVGKAQGLCNLIRSIPYHSARKSIILPQELLLKHSVSHEDVIRQKSSKSVNDIVFEIASSANSHLRKARSLYTSVPKKVQPILLPATALSFYLERLREADCDVYEPLLHERNAHLGWSLFWRRALGYY